jgi:hypothetical protein
MPKPRWIPIMIVTAVLLGLFFWSWYRHPDRSVPPTDLITRRLTTEGPVVGFSEPNGSHAWIGIPYAAPPVGNRRWQAPIDPPPRDREWMAVRAGAFCPQIGNPSVAVDDSLHGKAVGSEDCLYLNIWLRRQPPIRSPPGRSGCR